MPAPDRTPVRGAAFDVAASGAGFLLGGGLHPIAWVAWIAPAPVLALALAESTPRRAGILATIAWLVGSLGMVKYLAGLLPIPAVLLALFGPAIVFGVSAAIMRAAAPRLGPFWGPFAFPTAWAAYEWITAVSSVHGSWGSVAYSQMDALPVVQLAAIGGHVAIAFLVMLAGSALAFAWHHRARARDVAQALAPAALLAALAFGWGVWRLHEPLPGPTRHVGLAVSDLSIPNFDTRRTDSTLAVLRAYGDRVDRLAARGAEIVVLPEKLVGVADGAADTAVATVRAIARRDRVVLVAGVNRTFAHSKRNRAWVTYAGDEPRDYDKVHLVPGWEAGYTAGEEPMVLFDRGGPTLGVAICKDMDFPWWTERYADDAIGLMLVPAWDFGDDAWLHARMAILRGVEGGYSVARCAQEGSLTLSDPCGRVIAERASASAAEVLVDGVLPVRGVPTPYRAWDSGLVLVGLVWWLVRTAIKRGSV